MYIDTVYIYIYINTAYIHGWTLGYLYLHFMNSAVEQFNPLRGDGRMDHPAGLSCQDFV